MNSSSPNPDHEFDAKSFISSLSGLPGIYQMFDDQDKLLYVGKAKHLKNRVSSYFSKQSKSMKTRALVSKIANIEVTVTKTEVEALLLEQNLIKTHRPPYNILLRDDKSYPYIRISTDHEFPRLCFHRGKAQGGEGVYGPYPSSTAVKESLSFLQKVFKVRQCEDSYFKNRERPCLEHQINRCTAPCVNLISAADYAQDITHVKLFLEGKSQALTDHLSEEMEQASQALEFERAALLRDQIQALRHVQATQVVSNSKGDVDVIAIYLSQGHHCVQLLVVRDGNMLGGRSYVTQLPELVSESLILEAFLPQYYSRSELIGGLPHEILISHPVSNPELIEDFLHSHYQKKVKLSAKVRAHRQAWLDMAQKNAEQQVHSQLANKQNYINRFDNLNQWLSDVLAAEKKIKRIECVDISHTQGQDALGAFVVFNELGPLKSDYRKYNIRSTDSGDDLKAMNEVIERRFRKQDLQEGKLADLLLIDGGQTQVGQAAQVLLELGFIDVNILGIAKGPTRKAGFENYFYVQFEEAGFSILPLKPPNPGPAQYLFQEVRDEAHRFAISGHRNRRKKHLTQSTLESIPGVGAERRRRLLNHFGGLQGLKQASAEDIVKVHGISQALAVKIVDHLRA